MEPDQAVPKKLRTRFAPEGGGPDVEELRATCHRQTLVIDKLSDAISALRSDVTTLEGENASLRRTTPGVRRRCRSARPSPR